MQIIRIKDFSCIKSASLKVTPLTLIIGPQASGKSVISKLLYFCTSIIQNHDKHVVDEQLSLEALKKSLTVQFSEWFPVSAWGDKRFLIEFELEGFNLSITRIAKSDRVKIQFCEEFTNFYSESFSYFKSLIDKESEKDSFDFEITYQFRERANQQLNKWFGNTLIDHQLFIPAGRSFFTSIGKALVAFEHSGILDPVTLEFGRRFSALRERQFRRMGMEAPSGLAAKLFSEILGGTLKSEAGKEYVQASDGRMIPFSALSSGQQELLPLALCIRSLLPSQQNQLLNLTRAGRRIRRHIYIEEPEAHLFPRAQNQLVEILASLLTKRRSINLLITTHSPYVLSKFNNLIKVGQLAKPKSDLKHLATIIPETSWITPKSTSAYAIIDNKVHDILDEDGLIAADYLDNVSGDIAQEFSELLAYEFCR